MEENPSYYLHLKENQATPQLLDAVSDRIATEYIRLGLELGVVFEQILQFRLNNPHHTVAVVREILREWLNRNKQSNTAGMDRLAEALLRSGCTVEPLIEFVDKALSKDTQSEAVETDSEKPSLQKCLVM